MKKLKILAGILLVVTNITCTTNEDNNDSQLVECDFPTDITINDISTNSALINWTPDSNQISAEIEYGYSGFVVGSGTLINSTNAFYIIENLEPNTNYDVYIKTICDNEESDYFNVISFSTLCETIYQGDLEFSSQEELNSFSSCYTEINGTLRIGATGSDISTLLPLSNLNIIQGDLIIKSNNMLISLEGLSNISTINSESLIIEFNENLESISDLNGLTNIYYGNIKIRANNSLSSLNGLETLFENQNDFNSIDIIENQTLTSLNFQSINSCNSFFIYDNNSIESLQSMENLTSISNAVITRNDMLNDFCALQNLFMNGTYNESFVTFSENLFNPSIQDIIDGNCSQ